MADRNTASATHNRPGREGRYYTPAERIRLVPGVTCKQMDERSDMYAGTAEALERAGVLRAELLPHVGHVQISWRPGKRTGGSYYWTPAYLEIRRHHDGTYRARLVVSYEEQEKRKAAAEDERMRRREEQRTAQRPQTQVGANGQRFYDLLSQAEPGDLRAACLSALRSLGRITVDDDVRQHRSVDFTESARNRIGWLLGELDCEINGAQIVDRRHPGGGKGHLTLAWSAP